MASGTAYRPDPKFAALGPDFADPVAPAQFPQARLRWRNDRQAARIGLGHFDGPA
ncbi:MAG: selenoprotein O, partial [Alphaproteobacteria bacterium]|nr:selenoprotein O [Alphaproteobacteria bacterium]